MKHNNRFALNNKLQQVIHARHAQGSALPAVLVTVLVLLVVLGAAVGIGMSAGWLHLGGAGADAAPKTSAKTNGETQFICEGLISMPQSTLQSEPKVYTDMIIVGIDYAAKTGWYRGDFALSEGHKGSLKVNGTVATVMRPAMFERFGEMIIQEEFTLDSKDGKFVETLTFKGNKTRHMLKGTCAQINKAPFDAVS